MNILLHLLLTPLMLLIFWLFKKNPPKKINYFYGYRTPASMKNQDTWKEANAYGAKWGIKLMWGVLFFVQIPTILLMDVDKSLQISTVAMVIGLIAILPITEIHLRKIFNDRGEWKKEIVE